MKKSKFVGKTYGRQTVEKCYLNANYGQSTKHNYYHYTLVRLTSDKVCDKIITVSASTMTKISKGLVDVEKVAENKKNRNKDNILYRFN